MYLSGMPTHSPSPGSFRRTWGSDSKPQMKQDESSPLRRAPSEARMSSGPIGSILSVLAVNVDPAHTDLHDDNLGTVRVPKQDLFVEPGFVLAMKIALDVSQNGSSLDRSQAVR